MIGQATYTNKATGVRNAVTLPYGPGWYFLERTYQVQTAGAAVTHQPLFYNASVGPTVDTLIYESQDSAAGTNVVYNPADNLSQAQVGPLSRPFKSSDGSIYVDPGAIAPLGGETFSGRLIVRFVGRL